MRAVSVESDAEPPHAGTTSIEGRSSPERHLPPPRRERSQQPVNQSNYALENLSAIADNIIGPNR